MRTDTGMIIRQERIAEDIFQLDIRTVLAEEAHCGQFVQVEAPGFFLRRPISIASRTDDSLTLIYRIQGDGTRALSRLHAGDPVSLFGPLGNGFPVEDRDVMLIGGGIGVPPLYETAVRYREKGREVTAVLGFNDRKSIILKDAFEELGCRVVIATMDGSDGTKGTVLDAIRENGIKETFVLCCGPVPMLKALSSVYTDGYVSLEARMACGMGSCMGCVKKTADGGSVRVCSDGPVFRIGEVLL